MPLTAMLVKRPLEFAAFEWCNTQLGSKAQGPFLGGFIAGVISSVMGCPFSVVKVQMQASQKEMYRYSPSVFIDIWTSRGLWGFYRGISASMIMSVPSTTFFLGTYGVLRERLPQSSWTPALAGMTASIAMWSCLLPLDNVRTVIQAKTFKQDVSIGRWHKEFLTIVDKRGVRGLWAGYEAVLLRAPIMSAFSMLAYEQARSAVSSTKA